MKSFTITRIYTDQLGESRFDTISIPLHEGGAIGYLSEKYEVEELIFRKVLPSYDYDFHTAPARQFILLLDGRIEIESSLGEKREFGPGDVLLVEDTNGKGHRTRNLQNEERRSVFVTLKDQEP